MVGGQGTRREVKNAGVMVVNDIFMANPEKDKAETKTEGASDTPKCHIT